MDSAPKKERPTKSGIAWQRAFGKAVIQTHHETIEEKADVSLERNSI